MRIYVASSYSSHSGGKNAAYHDAFQAAIRCAEQKSVPIRGLYGGNQHFPCVWSPVVYGHIKWGADLPWKEAMHRCRAALREGNWDLLWVARTPGVSESKGVRMERQLARALGIQIEVES